MANDNNQQNTQMDGDVLGQLAANQATVKDVFQLEKGMNNTLNKIEKNQTKVNIVLSEIQKEIKKGGRVISSVDTKLQQIVTQITNIANQNKTPRGKNVDGTLETNVLDIASYVNDCSSYLDEIRKLLKNIDDRQVNNPNDGIPPQDDATKVDSLADINATLVAILEAIKNGVKPPEPKTERQTEEESERWHPEFDEIERLLKELQEREKAKQDRTLSQDAQDALDGLLSNIIPGYDAISGESLRRVTGIADKWGTGEYLTKDIVGGLGGALGDVAGGAVATAINAVAPGLGSLVGNAVDNAITKASESLGEWLSYFANHAKETRDALIKASLDKIKQDVKDMATYSITIQENALDKIYNAWDQNLSTVNATQGYTKEALNSLQDSVAQRLEREGYGNVINAADYATQLVNTLNSKLGGTLAETFAAQNLILQKAVPEIDLSSMAADFAAIYTNAQKQGLSGESEMVSAMNQIAGAVKALEQVTDGNNQFITQTASFLKKAEEVVNRSGGTADQIAELTTQLMAAEAPLSALVPELSGFTNTMVDTLMKGNDSTAVALRAIMHDINANVGISATDFMKSFVEDTQGTLATAYQAISEFISTNENEGVRQEFLTAIESVFGLQASQVAQIDFAQIADEIRNASVATNTQALTDAENLVRSGETTTWEDQLVNNTTNQLLATNAVRDTIDNKLMRKLEKNELELERTVYALESTQTIDFAEKTMAFFTNMFDIVTGLLDPLGLLDGLTTIADVWSSTEIDKASYNMVTSASQIGSSVTSLSDNIAADMRTYANTWGTAQNIAVNAMTTKSADVANGLVKNMGISDTLKELINNRDTTAEESMQIAAEELQAAAEKQQAEIAAQEAVAEATRQQQLHASANQTAFDAKRTEALQQQRALQEAERTMTTANHDNIAAIRESVSKLDELSNYLSPILDENRNQSNLLQSLAEKVDKLVLAVTNKAAQPAPTSVVPNVNTSYNERNRIYGPIKTW